MKPKLENLIESNVEDDQINLRSVEHEISFDVEQSFDNSDLEKELEEMKNKFLSEFYKLKFGDSMSSAVLRKAAMIFSKIKKLDFNAVEQMYVNLQEEIISAEEKSRDVAYENYNRLRREYFSKRLEGEKENRKVSLAVELLDNYKTTADDLNKIMEYKGLKKLDPNVDPPKVSQVILSQYETKSLHKINRELTELTNKIYETRAYIEKKKRNFLDLNRDLNAIRKSLLVQEALYDKVERRVRDLSSAMIFLHNKYITKSLQLVVKEAQRMNKEDYKLKKLSGILTDKNGDFVEANQSYNRLFGRVLNSLKMPFSKDASLLNVNVDNEALNDNIDSLNGFIDESRADRDSYFNKVREEFVKQKYDPPEI